jgi:hypothetical protein
VSAIGASIPWLASAGAIWLLAPLGAEGLDVRLAGDRIRVAAPRMDFLAGRPLERLRNGAPVPYALQLSLSTDRGVTTLARDIQRFVFSYDLWEEKFSVRKVGAPRRSQSHLSAADAQAWCVEQMTLATGGLGREQKFWVRLEVRAEEPDSRMGMESEDVVSLTELIEFFSRRTKGGENRWVADAGPLRIAELRKGAQRGLPAAGVEAAQAFR